MEKIVKFLPAYHKIDLDPKKNFGVGGVRCFMLLKGKKGCVHFVFNTGMHLPETYKYWRANGLHNRVNEFPDHMGLDVGYHSLKPHYEGQTLSRNECPWLDGRPCYGDGSALRSNEYMDILLREGSDKIWEMLEEEYKSVFES